MLIIGIVSGNEIEKVIDNRAVSLTPAILKPLVAFHDDH
jgi:hypothetical protein